MLGLVLKFPTNADLCSEVAPAAAACLIHKHPPRHLPCRGAVVCVESTCRATFHDSVFDRCSLIVMGGAQATLHIPRFMNMDRSEARLSVVAYGSGSHVHLHGGEIHGGVQGVAVQAAARLEASDLTVTGLQFVGLEVWSRVNAQRSEGHYRPVPVGS